MLQSIHSGRPQKVAREWIARSAFNVSADAYVQYLTKRGYAARTIEGYFASIAHFAHWIGEQRVRPSDLNEGLIQRFISEHLPDCRCALRCCRCPCLIKARMAPLLSAVIQPIPSCQGLDRILRDHPPVSDHDQLRYSEVITQTIDLWQQDLRVCCYRRRPTPPPGSHAHR